VRAELKPVLQFGKKKAAPFPLRLQQTASREVAVLPRVQTRWIRM